MKIDGEALMTQTALQAICRHSYTIVTKMTVESTNRRDGTACQATTVQEVMCSQCGDLFNVEGQRQLPSGVPATSQPS